MDFNNITERVCQESLAKLINFSDFFIGEDKMYLDTTILNECGALKYAEGLSSILNPSLLERFLIKNHITPEATSEDRVSTLETIRKNNDKVQREHKKVESGYHTSRHSRSVTQDSMDSLTIIKAQCGSTTDYEDYRESTGRYTDDSNLTIEPEDERENPSGSAESTEGWTEHHLFNIHEENMTTTVADKLEEYKKSTVAFALELEKVKKQNDFLLALLCKGTLPDGTPV